MGDADFFDQLRIYLPKYLSPEKQQELFAELKAFPNNRNLYSQDPSLTAELLQGDGWRGFVAINFHTLERKVVSGIVLSNSCDIDRRNSRALAPNIIFSPLIRLDRYAERLRQAGQSDGRIDGHFDALRGQRVSNAFYLPADGEMTESIALLDDVHGHPPDHFLTSERSSLFTLSQFGFYLFLFKLSIHLTRMQEEVTR